jgi:superfamily II DNA or RNA helicase
MTSPLQRWLTPDELESVAGRALTREARRLLDADCVDGFVEGVDLLEGHVTGRDGLGPYPASVRVVREDLVLDCACLDFLDAGVCAHPVALGLAWLAERKATGARGPAREAADPGPDRPERREDVLAWLAARQVSHAVRLPLAELLPALEPALAVRVDRFGYTSHPLVDKVLLRSERELLARTLGERDAQALFRAAWARVDAEVVLVERGLAEEAARVEGPPPLPTEARLQPLVDALLRARARVREAAPPRGSGAPGRTLSVSLTPPRLTVREESATVTPYTWQRPLPVQVTLRLAELLAGPTGVRCSCGAEEPLTRCVHALSALDDTLLQLASPPHAEENARLADALLSRGWTAVLDALTRVGLPPPPEEGAEGRPAAREEPPLEVSFRLHGGATSTPLLQAFGHASRKRGGGLTKGAAVSAQTLPRALASLPPQEREVLELLVATATADAARRRRALPALLRQLAGSPRLFLEERPETPARVREVPLGFSFTPDGEGAVEARPTLGGEPAAVEALLEAADRAPDGTPWLLVEPALARVTLVRAPPGAEAVLRTLKDYLPRFPADALPALGERLAVIERLFPVALPPELEARRIPADAGLVVRLVPHGDTALVGAVLCRPLAEAAAQVPGEGAPLLRGVRGEERVAVQRDLAAERVAAGALRSRLGLAPAEEGSGGGFTLADLPTALGFLERLEPLLGPGVEAEWPERHWRLLSPPPLRKVKVQVRTKRDWFNLEGEVLVEGEKLRLAALLEAARRRERYVPLGPGRFVRLTDELRERLGPLADVSWESRAGEVQLSRAAALMLEELREAGAEVDAPEAFFSLTRAVREASGRKVAVPRGLKAELRDYQREGFQWMARLCEWGAGGCLADEMGLGKTVQALALLLHRASRGPALVVAPTSVCALWAQEAARFAPSLQVTLFHEAPSRASAVARLGPKGVLVVSYALLAQHAELLSQGRFATLVVDEAQAVKNPDTARAQALRGIHAEARVALTGTPVENRLAEVWSLFSVTVPGLLGSREAFRERFVVPIERERNKERQVALSRALRPFVLRRTKALVARELPPRTEVAVPVQLSPAERRLYEQARLAVVAELGGAANKIARASRVEQALQGEPERFALLAAITRLRMLACHPKLGDATSQVPSSKTARLLELVQDARAQGGRVLVFSQFVRHLDLVQQALEARGVPHLRLDGSTPAPERAKRVAAFQGGVGDVFLISLKAGGTGLNLTGADHVVHLDPWWNPAVEDQATDRAHRIGQSKPVTVSRLIAEGTIEEAIVSLHQQKRELAESLLSEADGATALSPAQLLDLLAYTGEAA